MQEMIRNSRSSTLHPAHTAIVHTAVMMRRTDCFTSTVHNIVSMIFPAMDCGLPQREKEGA